MLVFAKRQLFKTDLCLIQRDTPGQGTKHPSENRNQKVAEIA